MTLISAGAVVLDGRVCRPGWLSVADGRIAECGTGPVRADVEFADCVVVPGFIDMHCHGGGGVGYPDGPDRAAALHA
ncbi:MAG: N-acetylglucosamine-6-phosphate deacetylase, partial [Mycolicibacter algericus]